MGAKSFVMQGMKSIIIIQQSGASAVRQKLQVYFCSWMIDAQKVSNRGKFQVAQNNYCQSRIWGFKKLYNLNFVTCIFVIWMMHKNLVKMQVDKMRQLLHKIFLPIVHKTQERSLGSNFVILRPSCELDST